MAGTPRRLALAVALALCALSVTTALVPGVAQGQTFLIAGVIRDSVTDAGVPGVTVTAGRHEGGASTPIVEFLPPATSVGTGVFQFPDAPAGTYTLTPTRTGYTFTPVSQVVTVNTGVGDKTDADFTATEQLYSISGTVTSAGGPVPDITVSDGYRTVQTDSTGTYTISSVPLGTFIVTPTDAQERFSFTPSYRRVTVAGENITGANFIAAAHTFTVSGIISDPEGNRMQGARVSVVGGQSVAVSSAAGVYTLGNVPAGTVALEATLAGFTLVGAGGRDLSAISVTGNLSNIDIVAYPTYSKLFAAGVHLLGVPVEPVITDPVATFGTAQVARYISADADPWVLGTADPTNADLLVAPGAGFFVSFPTDREVVVYGTDVPLSTPFSMTLLPGWNLVANPFPSSLPFFHLVPAGTAHVRPYGFTYNPTTRSYELVSADAAFGTPTALSAWEGTWLYVTGTGGQTLTVSPPTAATAAAPPATAKKAAGGWMLPVTARMAGGADCSTLVGVREAGAFSALNPPPLSGGVDVYVSGPGGTRLAADLRGPGALPAIWDLWVAGGTNGAPVELSLPDLTRVPPELQVTLTDVAAGRTYQARTMSAVRFRSATDTPRQFRLTVSSRTAAPLTLRTTAAMQRGGTVSVSYVLSAAADVSAVVRNTAGRPVRQLCVQRSAEAGVNTLQWNLTSDAGAMVPNGRYLLELEASSAGGDRVRALTTVSVAR